MLRKVAANLKVQQCLTVTKNDLCIENDSGLGKSAVTYPVNVDKPSNVWINGEWVQTEATFDPNREFPLQIVGDLPALHGSTMDRRRLTNDNGGLVMEQKSLFILSTVAVIPSFVSIFVQENLKRKRH